MIQSKSKSPLTDEQEWELRRAVEQNSLMAKSRAVQPVLTGDGLRWPDMTVPRSQRLMGGLDIDEWRGELKLSKFEAESALGYRSTTLYNEACARPVLPITTEILLRLYDEKPEPCPWSRLTFRQLFDMMYGRKLQVFSGVDLTRAKIDMSARFTIMFGRSTTRAYAWLSDDTDTVTKSASSYADVERILSKLTQWKDPAATFERVASQCLLLRGVDIDELFPVPTKRNPPERRRPGRKPSAVPTPRRRAAAKKTAAASKKAAGAAAKKRAPAAKKAAAKSGKAKAGKAKAALA